MSHPYQPQQPGQQPPPGSQPLGPPPQPMMPMQQPKPPKQKRFGFLALGLTALASLGIGAAVGGSGDGGTATAGPAPTVTVTKSVAQPASEPTEAAAPEPDPTTQAPAAWNPKPKDFKVGVKVTDKQCFGSAGCNLTYKISLDYLGSQKLPDEGTTDITYKIAGAEQEILGTITLNSEGKFDSYEESTSTTSSSKKLSAKVTEVDYNEFG